MSCSLSTKAERRATAAFSVGQLELTIPMRCQTVGVPNLLNGAAGNTHGFGHVPNRPMRCTAPWWAQCSRRRFTKRLVDDLGDNLLWDWCLARWSGLIAEQTVDTVGHETLLPAPDARLALARAPHDLVGSVTVRCQQHDLCTPDMLLRTVPIANDRFKPLAISRIEPDLYSASHLEAVAQLYPNGNLLYRTYH